MRKPIDIENTAYLLVRKFANEAYREAVRRAYSCCARGDQISAQEWHQVAFLIEALTCPNQSTTLH